VGADGGCKEVVRKLQAFAALKVDRLPSSSTAAYCKARQKLNQASLKLIFKHAAESTQAVRDMEGLNGHRVIAVVDGTAMSMPGRPMLRKQWNTFRSGDIFWEIKDFVVIMTNPALRVEVLIQSLRLLGVCMSARQVLLFQSFAGSKDASMMVRMKELEAENSRLKRMYAEERLKYEIIQEAMVKIPEGHTKW